MQTFILPVGQRHEIHVSPISTKTVVQGEKTFQEKQPLQIMNSAEHVLTHDDGVIIDLQGIEPCEFDVVLANGDGQSGKFHVSAQNPPMRNPMSVTLS